MSRLHRGLWHVLVTVPGDRIWTEPDMPVPYDQSAEREGRATTCGCCRVIDAYHFHGEER